MQKVPGPKLAEADSAFQNALKEFLSVDRETRISTLRSGLTSARPLTLEVLRWVSIDERKELLPDLMYLARAAHGYIGHFRDLILSLPKDWLLEHIEAVADPILRTGDDEEYRRFLELYLQIDQQLARRLLQRSLASENADIREVGKEFTNKLEAL